MTTNIADAIKVAKVVLNGREGVLKFGGFYPVVVTDSVAVVIRSPVTTIIGELSGEDVAKVRYVNDVVGLELNPDEFWVVYEGYRKTSYVRTGTRRLHTAERYIGIANSPRTKGDEYREEVAVGSLWGDYYRPAGPNGEVVTFEIGQVVYQLAAYSEIPLTALVNVGVVPPSDIFKTPLLFVWLGFCEVLVVGH